MEKTYPMAIVSAPGKIEFQKRKLPKISPRDVLIGVKACSICGSDLHVFKGKHPAAPLPTSIGHELSGEVIEAGESVSRVRVGDRVVVEPVIICGECYFCRRGQYSLCTQISFQYRKGQGGFTPYFVAHEDWVHLLPGDLSFEEGTLIEPLSVALHAVRKAELQLGHTLAIFGAGPIGLLILLLARLSGVGEVFVVDVQEHRLKKAKKFGASEVLNNSEGRAFETILERTSQLGVDRSFEAAGLEETFVQSLKVLKKGGTSVLIGIFEKQDVTIPANLFIQKEISLIGSQGYCWDFQGALKLIQQGSIELKEMITHVIPLSSLEEGFKLLLDATSGAIKVVIKVQ